jgi:hypothetical protein
MSNQEECVPETVLKSLALSSMPAMQRHAHEPAQERVVYSDTTTHDAAVDNSCKNHVNSMQHNIVAGVEVLSSHTSCVQQTTHQIPIVPNITLYPPSAEPSPLAPRQLQFSTRHNDDNTQATPNMYTQMHESQYWHATHDPQPLGRIPHMQLHDEQPICPTTVHEQASAKFSRKVFSYTSIITDNITANDVGMLKGEAASASAFSLDLIVCFNVII